MTGVLINTIMVIVGSCVGLLLKKGHPPAADQRGDGRHRTEYALYRCRRHAAGGRTPWSPHRLHGAGCSGGNLWTWTGKIQSLGIGSRTGSAQPAHRRRRPVSLAQGLSPASLLFCVGSMTIGLPQRRHLQGQRDAADQVPAGPDLRHYAGRLPWGVGCCSPPRSCWCSRAVWCCWPRCWPPSSPPPPSRSWDLLRLRPDPGPGPEPHRTGQI